jgi:hypothetical protein
MAKWEQDSAQEIAAALHKAERALQKLHRVLHEKAKEHSEALGIDVAPLSGGLEKPPRP